MRRFLASMVLVVVLASAPHAAVAQATSALPVAASPEAVGFDSARLKRLDAYIASRVAEGDVAGATYLLARHGKVVAFNSHGKQSLATGAPMRPDTIFRIYSMTKPITGVAMMMLFEEGKWRLSDPVTKFIPEFADLKVMTGLDAQGRPILEDAKRPPTMRELMSHTAGFGYGLSDQSDIDKLYRAEGPLQAEGLQQMIERIAELPLYFQPGSEWGYSIAVDIQGHIVEKLSGMTLGAFFEERIFKPLKMNDTGFFAPPSDKPRLAALYEGDGQGGIREVDRIWGWPVPDYLSRPALESGGYGLVSTAADYARFCQMLLNGGELDGVRLLAPATVELMGTNMISEEALETSFGGFDQMQGFGADFDIAIDPRANGSLVGPGTLSWGGAAGTWFWIDPANDVIFVGMIQRMDVWGVGEMSTPTKTLTYQALVEPAR